MKKTVLLEGKEYDYILNRKKVKNITLRISSKGDISVSAPIGVSEKIITQFIVNKQHWIVDKLNKIREDKKQKGNRDISILGKDYKIKVQQSSERTIFFDEDYIVIQIKRSDGYQDFVKVCSRWYNQFSDQVIRYQCSLVYEKLVGSGIPSADIKIRSMKARWGSCYYNKNLVILNRHLIQLPKELINHVILHEYAHFKHHNHGKTFKNFLRQMEQDADNLEKIIRHTKHDDLDFNKVFLRKDDGE